MERIIIFYKNNFSAFFVSFVLSFTIFLLFPIVVYYQNIEFVAFNLIAILPILIILSFIGLILFSLITILLTRRLKFFPILLTSLIVGLWFQGNIIKYNIGVLDGREIIWKECYKFFWIELLIWFCVFVIFIIFREIILKQNHTLLIFLTLLNVIPIIFMLFQNNNYTDKKIYFDYTNEFRFSNENVIIIVLDTFRSDAFKQILQEYPEFGLAFKDFVFFDDVIGGYPTTYPSIPLILTGDYYKNLIPIQDYLKTTGDLTISNKLQENGYLIENYPIEQFYASLYDNKTNNLPISLRLSSAMQQLFVAGIKYSPLPLKPYFVVRYYYENRTFIHRDLIDFNSRVNEVNGREDQPIFKFIHLSGAHQPLMLDKSLNWHNAGYIQQAAGSLVPIKNLILELKKAGIYDESLIIILGDHGSSWPDEYSGPRLLYFAQPLLLGKRPNQHFEEMQMSESKVSLVDIAKTIAEETQINTVFPGYSIFNSIPIDRKRYFYYYNWDHSYWTKEYLPIMYEFEIIGSVNPIESWRLVRQYSDGYSESKIYSYGDNMVDFILSNDTLRFLLSTGFEFETNNKQSWSWGTGPEACINLSVTETNESLNLSFDAIPFLVDGKLNDQEINVFVDNILIGNYSNTSPILPMSIPSSIATQVTLDKKVYLCFKFPEAEKSPLDYGISEDSRKLGYRFSSIILSTADN